MNINFLIKFINLILLLILIKLLKKCYFVYITLPFKCVYLYNKLFTVFKKKIFFFINIILYSLLNIYINFQLFTGKFFNLLRFCFYIYQHIKKKYIKMNKKNLINIIPFILLLIVITSLKFYYYMYILFNLTIINVKLLKILNKFTTLFAMAIDFLDIQNFILNIYNKKKFIVNYV